MTGEGRALLAEGTAYAKTPQGSDEWVTVDCGVPSGRGTGHEVE